VIVRGFVIAGLILSIGCARIDGRKGERSGRSLFPTGEGVEVKMVSSGLVSSRVIRIVPRGDGAEVSVAEKRETDVQTPSSAPSSGDKQGHSTDTGNSRTVQISRDAYRTLWESFPNDRLWTLKDDTKTAQTKSLPFYTISLSRGGRSVKVEVYGPQALTDLAYMRIISSVEKVAHVNQPR